MGRAPRCNRGVTARRLVLVTNPEAAGGKALRLIPVVRKELDSLALDYEIVEARDIAHAANSAAQAAAADKTVVAMGGDGLVGALAAAVRGKGPLGVLPAGRGNDFARELSIPTDVAGACRVLAEGVARPLDLGEANGKPFICIASTGYDSEANRIANEARLVRGNLVYAYAAVRALVSWRPARFSVHLDGEDRSFEGYTVVAANTRFYGGGMRVAPNAKPGDGLLEVVLIENTSKLRFLSNLPKVFSAKHVELEGVRSFRARQVEISADRPFDVYADGDRLTTLPATIRVLPHALHVIAPSKLVRRIT
jgi:YegS/Rv2252/BmrU family lipid kinase